ncbi:tyrosyl-DNA phosphodiesterase-domain-containing protein [Aspergillus filifer]
MDSDDEDLKAAIAASLGQAPSPTREANNHDTSVVDLTAESDDDVVPIFPKSKSVVSSEVSREASVIDVVDEDDEDLRAAIALSLQASRGQANMDELGPTSAPESKQIASPQANDESKPTTTRGGFQGLDRKKMEEERLARLAKRKADEPPAIEQRELKQPRVEHQQNASNFQAASMPAPSAPSTKPSIQFPAGTVKKTYVSGHRRSGDDIKIEEVLQSGDLELAVLSSFIWDIDWLFGKVDLTMNRLLLVMQAETEAKRRQYTEETESIKSLRLCFPPMDGQISCMHSKLMLLFHPGYLRIAVPTANLTPFDWGEEGGLMENSVFLIDLPKKDASTPTGSNTNFYSELVYFLKATTLHENIIGKLDNFDFSKTAKFAFTHTIGGSHSGTSWQRTGYCGLGRSVGSLGLRTDKPVNLDFVTSSLGHLNSDFMRCLYFAAQGDNGLTELTLRTTKSFPVKSPSEPRRLIQASTSDEWKDRVRVYYPSQETIRNSKGGPNAAGTICFQDKWLDSGKFPKQVLRDCVSGREGLLMHNKILFMQPDEPVSLSDNSQCLGWAYVGSANCSESAWGRLVTDRTTKKPKLNCRNWECGVVVPVIKEAKKTTEDLDAYPSTESESGLESEVPIDKKGKAKKKIEGDNSGSRTRIGSGREEDGHLLDSFSGTVPVPMRLPGQRLGGTRKPWSQSWG